MATESGIFQWIAGSMDQTLKTFIKVTSANVIDEFTITIIGFGTLYFVMLGYMMVQGHVENAWSSFFKNCGKFLLISALAMNVGTYGMGCGGAARP